MKTPPDILGECIGITFEEIEEGHFIAYFMIEDDGNWHKTTLDINVHWLDDLIQVAQLAKQAAEKE